MSYEKIIRFKCDNCGLSTFVKGSNVTDAKKALRRQGWKMWRTGEFCPSEECPRPWSPEFIPYETARMEYP